MYRSMPIAFLALMMGGHVASQPPWQAEDSWALYFPGTTPLRKKELAKDKFQAMHADLKALAQAKLEAVRDEFGSRYREFIAGRGTLDFLIEVTQRLREAELGVAKNGAERLAAYERCWSVLRVVEKIDIARYDAGRIPIQDLAQSTYARLDAEIQWIEERERQKQK